MESLLTVSGSRSGAVQSQPGPRPGLADPMRDEDVGRRPGHALVAIHREAREVDGVAVRRDRRLIVAELVVRRERQLLRDELLVGRPRTARRHHGRNDRRPEDSARGPEKVPARQCAHDVLLPAGWLRAIDRSTPRPRTTPPAGGLSSEPTEVHRLPGAGWSRVGMVGCGRRVRPAAAVTWAPGKIEAKARSDLSDDRVEASQHRRAAAAVVARVAAG